MAAQWQQTWALIRERFETEHAALIADLTAANSAAAIAEAELRRLALESYASTGNKKPGPGVAIRVVTRLEYDAGAATQWAYEHRTALTLDRKAFEGIAKSGSIGPDIVKRVKEATATIATDLAAALGEVTNG